MNIKDYISVLATKFAQATTHGSYRGVEAMYDRLDSLGFAWIFCANSIKYLGFDEIILAPSKTKLVPVPLVMTTSERTVKEVFKAKEGDIVVDVGTYIGRFTINAAKKVGTTGKVIGIEPNPENYAILRKNVSITNSNNVTTVNAAASDRPGTMRMYKGPAGGWTTIKPITSKYFDVDCVTIDDTMDKLGIDQVDWIKIDVEGAGLLVLEGAKRTLERSKNLRVIMEVHTFYGESGAIEWFNQHKYRTENIEPHARIYHVLATRKD